MSGPSAEEAFEALFTLDIILAKAVAAPEFDDSVAVEVRLYRTLMGAWLSRAARAVTGATRVASNRGNPAAVERAVASAFSGLGEATSGVVEKAMDEVYRLSKTAATRRIAGRKEPLVANPTHVEPIGKAKASAEVKPVFGLEDKRAIKSLARKHTLWIGAHYEESVSERIRSIASEYIVGRGLSAKDAGKAIEKAFRTELGLDEGPTPSSVGLPIPPGYAGRQWQYFEGVAANAATVGRVAGSLKAFTEAGVAEYEIVNPDDERTCAVCGKMRGKKHSVENASKRMEKEIAAKTPFEVKRLHPFVGDSLAPTINAGHKSPGDSKTWMEFGVGFPPFHFRCRCTIDVTADFEGLD